MLHHIPTGLLLLLLLPALTAGQTLTLTQPPAVICGLQSFTWSVSGVPDSQAVDTPLNLTLVEVGGPGGTVSRSGGSAPISTGSGGSASAPISTSASASASAPANTADARPDASAASSAGVPTAPVSVDAVAATNSNPSQNEHTVRAALARDVLAGRHAVTERTGLPIATSVPVGERDEINRRRARADSRVERKTPSKRQSQNVTESIVAPLSDLSVLFNTSATPEGWYVLLAQAVTAQWNMSASTAPFYINSTSTSCTNAGDEQPNNSNTGTLIAIGVGSAAAVLLVIALCTFWWCCVRGRGKRRGVYRVGGPVDDDAISFTAERAAFLEAQPFRWPSRALQREGAARPMEMAEYPDEKSSSNRSEEHVGMLPLGGGVAEGSIGVRATDEENGDWPTEAAPPYVSRPPTAVGGRPY